MRRRAFLATVGAAGAAGTAGCGLARSETTLSEPTVRADSDARRSLHFATDGEEVGSLGVTGSVASGVIDLRTEIWHRQGTDVTAIALRVWMPDAEADSAVDVAVVSPVEGDGSPPPSLSLSSPRRDRGTVIEVTDLDDLADETISTLELLVRSRSETATTLAIDATIGLAAGGWLGTDYTLDGRLDLAFPELGQ